MKIGYINGLRGLAILMVVWHHWYSRSVSHHTPELIDPLVLAGHYGVEVFFVLSGFVLYLPWRDGRAFHARTYLIRRAKRLLPLFYVALLVSAALHRENPLPFALLLYPNSEAIGPGFNFPLWSISAEIWFSALLPLLVPLMRRPAAPWLLIAASFACILGPEWLQRSLPGMLYLFILGMLAAAHLGKVEGTVWVLPLAVAAVYLPDQIGRPAAGLAAAGVILYCWSHRQAPLTRALQNRALQTLGIMCFSIYVWHEPVRFVTGGYHAFSPIQLANWALLAVVAVSSYRLVERGADLTWRGPIQALPEARPAPPPPLADGAPPRASVPRPASREAA